MEKYNRTVRLQVFQGKKVGFLAQEKDQYIQAIHSNAKAALCPGIILLNEDVLIPVILIRLGNNTIYMVYFNYHNPEDRKSLESLVRQDKLYLVFYNDAQQKSFRVAIANSTSHFFQQAKSCIEKLPAWSAISFDKAVAALHDFRAHELWKQFGQAV